MSRNKTKSVQCEKQQIVMEGLLPVLWLILLSLPFGLSDIRYCKSLVIGITCGRMEESNAPPVPFQPKNIFFFGYWFDGEDKK